MGSTAPPEYPKMISIPISSRVFMSACAPSNCWLFILKMFIYIVNVDFLVLM